MGAGGENHSVPADSLAPDEASELINLRPMPDGSVPVWGYSEVSTPKGTPLEILNINLYKELDGTSRLIRIDEDDLQHWNGSSWATISGNGDAMTGDQDDRIRSAMVLNQLIWVNGVDEPKAWQVGDANYADLTSDVNAPDTARHVVAFADRVVFADVDTGSSRNPQRLEWSASGDATDFTTLGAGGVTLFDTSDDAASDDIVALKVFDVYLVVFRQRSIWVGQRTGEADAPIRFHSVIQGVGATAEDSVQVIGEIGIIFLGADNIYLFHPNNRDLVPIGEPIKTALFGADTGKISTVGHVIDLSALERVRSAYVSQTKCYHLFYPVTGETWARRSWVFDVGRYQNEQRFVWHRRTYGTKDITAAFGGQTSGLGSTHTQRENRLLLGTDLGELFETTSAATDDDGTAITWSFESPDFSAGQKFLDLRRLSIAYNALDTYSTVDLGYRVDGTLTTVSNETFTDSGVNDIALENAFWAPLGSYGRTVSVRVSDTVGNSSGLRLLGYRIGFLPRGEISTTF